MNTYKPVIGLEVHIELSTNTKMFCSCLSDHFGKKPNTQTCPICLGLPGTLPFPNKEAVLDTIKFGLAFGCQISEFSKFDRKHYFYPDLPKGYQISQYDLPICSKGEFIILSSKKKVSIRRIHIEEDTAKLVHDNTGPDEISLVDFNRSGVALVELVTEPDFSESSEVVEFLKEVQLIAKYLGISNADMEKGSMRLEANVSVSNDDKLPNYKIELKNINSFRFMEKAINAEVERQIEELKAGRIPVQETRGFNETTGKTYSQRTKEEAKDYRYFPEPDIPPMKFDYKEIESIKSQLSDLPNDKRTKLMSLSGMTQEYVEILLPDIERVGYFEKCVELGDKLQISAKEIADLMINKSFDKNFDEPELMIRKIFELRNRTYSDAGEIQNAVELVMRQNAKAVEDFRSGKEQILGFLIGQVQKQLKGNGDPKKITETLLTNLRKN